MGHTRTRKRLGGISKTISTEQCSLSQQYGGVHTGEWVNLFPPPWTPYIQLCRLSPPVAVALIYLPYLFGVLHSASLQCCPVDEVLHACLVLLTASFFGNNAVHAWNDIVDAPIDAQIERTRTRPIPRGDITPCAAFCFALTQALGFVITLSLFLPTDAALIAVPAMVGTVYYPYAKRHTHFPQFVLGFCLSWSILVGSMTIDVKSAAIEASTLCLLAASVQWVVIFDTIYAHQDFNDDAKVGVKSTAVLFQGRTKVFLWVLFLGMNIALLASGYLGRMSLPYYMLAVGGCVLSVGTIVSRVDLSDPTSCWLYFSKGFCMTGAMIAGGLLAEYGLKCGLGAN